MARGPAEDRCACTDFILFYPEVRTVVLVANLVARQIVIPDWLHQL